MKLNWVTIPAIILAGCASQQPQYTRYVAQSSPNQPIRSIGVDCRYAPNYYGELESIIANPLKSDTMWEETFATVHGTNTPQQRMASAKTVLWSVRTQCPGY